MPHTVEQTSFSSGNTKKYQRKPSLSLSIPKLRSPTSLNPSDGGAKFPRIDECVHFHYETVDCGKIELKLLDEAPDNVRFNGTFDFEKHDAIFWISVKCKGKSWVIRRIPAQFEKLDELLHECVFDRKFTQLQLLDDLTACEDKQVLHTMLGMYISRLSDLPEDQMSCAPLLHWFDMDNKGTKLVAALRETADINIPAVAAAHTVRRYTAQLPNELSLEVGDMVSIIDMSDPNWWRGKCKLQVGSFPAQCVKRISDARQADEVHAVVNSPSSPTTPSSPSNFNTSRTKPITKKHGKFMDFLRSFLVTRPTKSRLKQSGILKERVFGCDLGEYLHNCADDVPVVVKDCTDFVEKYGIVDGIYRISGVASHVQNLRHEYDCERRPDMNRDPSGKGEQSICDPHSVAGLCKLYFRELPNPLLTYQLYNRFAAAIAAPEDDRLLKIHDVIQQLPPPHYRTLQHLAIHLQFMSKNEEKTSMHCRNLAIVWAPNLLRSRDLEAGLAAFTEARVQSVVTEFLIANADILFSDQLQNIQLSRGQKPPRPKSLMVLSGPKLISLEEAQARSRAGDGFSKPSSENFIGIEDQIQLRRRKVAGLDNDQKRRHRRTALSAILTDGELRRKSSDFPFKLPSPGLVQGDVCKPNTTNSVNSGDQSSMKRRQSMDPKLGTFHEHNQFPTDARQLQHSSGSISWKSKLGNFLKKGNNFQAEYQEPASDGALRRSQSDDSMLSAHSMRQNDHEISKSELKDAAAVKITAMRLSNSPRTPRPKGNIYLSGDSLAQIDGCSDLHIRTPCSIPTPSSQTHPSSHNPFSELDSDFPGVMGDSGLGFNPLQYSPSFSSDSGIPDLPKCSDDQSFEDQSLMAYHPQQGNVNAGYGPRVAIGCLEDIKTSKQASNSSKCRHVPTSSSHETPSQLHSIPTSSKIQDILLANAKLREGALNTERSDGTAGMDPFVVPKAPVDPSDSLPTMINISEATEVRNHNASNNRIFPNDGYSSENDRIFTQINQSSYWKTEEIDSLSEINELKLEQSMGERVENTSPFPSAPHKTISREKSQPVDLPETGSYSVQYACNQENSNGRSRQSIVATFVQDRPQDSRIRRPHSIRRSFDVPPTDIQQSSRRRLRVGNPYQQRTIYDITRRNQAYASWVSQHQKENFVKPADHWHYRSLSAGDGLRSREQPLAHQRCSTKASLLTRENFSTHKRIHEGPFLHTPKVTSATYAPLSSEFPTPELMNEQVKPSRQIEPFTPNPKVHLCSIDQIPHVYKNPVTALSEQTVVAKPPQPGIVSPSDSVRASTVLSWV